MNRKALALDIDGTLVNSAKEITPATFEALREMMEAGHLLILSSGRPTPGMEFFAKQLRLERYGGYIVSFNGARVSACGDGEILFQRTLPPEVPGELFSYVKKQRVIPGLITYLGREIISAFPANEFTEKTARNNHMPVRVEEDFETFVDFGVNKCMITAAPEEAQRMEKELQERYPDLSVCRSENYFLEVMPGGTSKAEGVRTVIEREGIPRENLICCGDAENDISMIRYAGIGVAMGNAKETVKTVADHVAGSNEEDALVDVIRRFILG